jgi:hypothetical protein
MTKYFTKKRKTRAKKMKIVKKTRRNRKGGLLFNQKLNIGGIDLERNTGQKRYNWKTNKWDDVICYKVGPIPFCKIVPAK